MKFDYILLFAVAILTVAGAQTFAGTTHLLRFLHGALLGTSIGCTVLGLILYTRSSKKS